MDIADLWRSMRAGRADAFRVGAHLETAGAGSRSAQECQSSDAANAIVCTNIASHSVLRRR
jgi:hypothetical protein